LPKYVEAAPSVSFNERLGDYGKNGQLIKLRFVCPSVSTPCPKKEAKMFLSHLL